MNSPLEIRKVIWGAIIGILFVCIFLFFPSGLAIDWTGNLQVSSFTFLKPFVELLGLLVIVFYHILNRASPESNKLSLTAILTICWLSLILFYPFKDPTNTNAGAIGFFALVGGLAVVVLWVRFFSDEIVA